MNISDFARAIASGNTDPYGVLQYLSPEVKAKAMANPTKFIETMNFSGDLAKQWDATAYNDTPLGLITDPTRRDRILQQKQHYQKYVPLTGALASNEGAWKEGYKNSFKDAVWDDQFGLLVPGKSLKDYEKQIGMSPDQMAMLAAIAVGGGIMAPQAIGGAGGLGAAGTQTTLADMIASGVAFPGTAGAAGAGAGAVADAAGATGLDSLPNAGTWAQTAVPGEAAPLGAGAEVGSGITTAGGGLGGSQLTLGDVAGVPTPTGSGVPTAGAPSTGSGVLDKAITAAKTAGTGITMKDILGAVLGVGTSIYGSKLNSDAIGDAAGIQADANQKALDEMKRQFDIGQGNLAPWLSSGKTALGQLDTLTAPNGEFNQPFDMSKFYDDAGYRFRLGEGEQATNRAAAARGGFNSGRTLKELQRWSQGLASDEYGKAFDRFQTTNTSKFNRLAALSGIGQQTASQLNSSGNNYGSNVANTITSGANAAGAATIANANARTSGYTGAAGAVMNMINNSNQQQLLRDILAGG